MMKWELGMLQKKFRMMFFLSGAFIIGMSLLFGSSYAAPSVSCSAPAVTAIAGGGSNTINVDCTVTGVIATDKFSPSGQNKVTTASLTLANGSNTLPATLGATVSSPDYTVSGLTAPSGFTGTFLAVPAKIRFTYTVPTIPTTPTGTYNSTANSSLSWQIRSASNTNLGSGMATAGLSLIVPISSTVVSCSSIAGSAPAGGGSLTLNVDCVLTGSQSSITPSGSNKFTPTSIVFSNGANTITGTLQSAITSPNSTVGSIAGTSSGFTGTVTSFPATVRAQYNATTLSTTPSGTYTSTTVTYTWATL